MNVDFDYSSHYSLRFSDVGENRVRVDIVRKTDHVVLDRNLSLHPSHIRFSAKHYPSKVSSLIEAIQTLFACGNIIPVIRNDQVVLKERSLFKSHKPNSRPHDEGFSFSLMDRKSRDILSSQKVMDQLETFRSQGITLSHLDFHIEKPEDLHAANLLIQELFEEEVKGINSKNQLDNAEFRQTKKGKIDVIQILKDIGLLNSGRVLIRGLNETDKSQIIGKLRGRHKLNNVESQDLAQQICEVLQCVHYRNSIKSIRLIIAGSKFLNPAILSEMSGNKITVRQAYGLINGLHFRPQILQPNKGNSSVSSSSGANVSSPSGEWKRVTDIFDEENPNTCIQLNESELIFRPEVWIHPSLYERLITNIKLYELFNQGSSAKSREEVLDQYVFWIKIELIQKYEAKLDKLCICKKCLIQFCDDAYRESALSKTGYDQIVINEIREYIYCFKFAYENYQKPLEELQKEQERSLALFETRAEDSQLPKIFDENKHIIHQFLKLYSTEKRHFSKPNPLHVVSWNIGGYIIREEIRLERSCRLYRRLFFDGNTTEKEDLTYEQISQRWDSFKLREGLFDDQLAEACLHLYHHQAWEESCSFSNGVKQFAASLTILLMGKEVSLDNTALIANYILLQAMAKNIISLKGVIDAMPASPAAAMANKQYLEHICCHHLNQGFSGFIDSHDHSKTQSSHFWVQGICQGTAKKLLERYEAVIQRGIQAIDSIDQSHQSVWGEPIEVDSKTLALRELKRENQDHGLPLSYNEDLSKLVIDFFASIHPLKESRPKCVGIRKMGQNSCFNAAMQLIIHSPLKHFFANDDFLIRNVPSPAYAESHSSQSLGSLPPDVVTEALLIDHQDGATCSEPSSTPPLLPSPSHSCSPSSSNVTDADTSHSFGKNLNISIDYRDVLSNYRRFTTNQFNAHFARQDLQEGIIPHLCDHGNSVERADKFSTPMMALREMFESYDLTQVASNFSVQRKINDPASKSVSTSTRAFLEGVESTIQTHLLMLTMTLPSEMTSHSAPMTSSSSLSVEDATQSEQKMQKLVDDLFEDRDIGTCSFKLEGEDIIWEAPAKERLFPVGMKKQLFLEINRSGDSTSFVSELPEDIFEVKIGGANYELKGFVTFEHLPGSGEGMFVSYCHVEGNWYRFEDENVEELEGEQHPPPSSSSSVSPSFNLDRLRGQAKKACLLSYVNASPEALFFA